MMSTDILTHKRTQPSLKVLRVCVRCVPSHQGRTIFSYYQTLCRIRDTSWKSLILTDLKFFDQFQTINVSVYLNIVEIANNKACFVSVAVY